MVNLRVFQSGKVVSFPKDEGKLFHFKVLGKVVQSQLKKLVSGKVLSLRNVSRKEPED